MRVRHCLWRLLPSAAANTHIIVLIASQSLDERVDEGAAIASGDCQVKLTDPFEEQKYVFCSAWRIKHSADDLQLASRLLLAALGRCAELCPL